jgi:acyl-CoA thioester hydrolase
MGIIHHSNYIKWFEEARIDFLGQIGLPYNLMEQRGLLIPVLGVGCKYRKAFRYGDTFQIQLKITEFRGVKFSIQYEVYHKETGELHATGVSEHGFVDRTLAPVGIKRDYPDVYEKLLPYVEDGKTSRLLPDGEDDSKQEQ